MYSSNHRNILIVDIGTSTSKIGYCGTEQPDIYESSRKFNYESPIQNSTIHDIDLYARMLGTYIKEDAPTILVQNTYEARTGDVLMYLMERRMVRNILFVRSAVAELFGAGRGSGLVVSMGGGSIQVSSVVDGCVTAREQMGLGGEEIVEAYRNQVFCNQGFLEEFKAKRATGVHKKGVSGNEELLSIENRDVVNISNADVTNGSRNIKNGKNIIIGGAINDAVSSKTNSSGVNENNDKLNFEIDEFCREAKDATLSLHDNTTAVFEKYGLKAEIGSYRYEIPRKMIAENGIPALINRVLEENDVNIRNTLINNTVIAGEGRVKGIADELTRILLPKYSRMRTYADINFSSFLGCSILGTISLTKQHFITIKDYEEYGVGILKRKNCDWMSF